MSKLIPGFKRLKCGCQVDKKDPEWIIPYVKCKNPKHMPKKLKEAIAKSTVVRGIDDVKREHGR